MVPAEARSVPPFPRTSRPRIRAPWLLRDDGDNLLLYKCTYSDLKYRVLSPVQALILPFFSGQRTYAEIQAIWLHLVKACNRSEGVQSLHELVCNLTDPDAIVATEGEPSWCFRDRSKIPMPNFENYRWPAERASIPVSVLIAPTNRCVANCVYCYAERDTCPELTTAEWIAILDQMAAHSIRIVDFAGADPFMRADVFDLLRSMTDHGFTFSVSTKSHVSEGSAGRLAELGIGREVEGTPEKGMQVSVDSASNPIASSLTGVRNYLGRAISTTKNLIAAGLDPRIKCVLTPFNWEEPAAIVELFSALGARRFQFVQYGRSIYRHADDLFLTREQKMSLSESMPELAARHPKLEITFQDETGEVRSAAQVEAAWQQRAVCTGGRSALMVLPNGDVSLCEQLPHKPEFVVGNLLRQSLLEIWNGPELERFIHPERRKFEGTVCFSCPEFDACHLGSGYCYRDSFTAFGTLYDAPPACPRQQKTPLRLI